MDTMYFWLMSNKDYCNINFKFFEFDLKSNVKNKLKVIKRTSKLMEIIAQGNKESIKMDKKNSFIAGKNYSLTKCNLSILEEF